MIDTSCVRFVSITQKSEKDRYVNYVKSSSDFGSLLRVFFFSNILVKCVEALNEHLGFVAFVILLIILTGFVPKADENISDESR